MQGDNYFVAGNPNLKHVTADNFDFRFEYFPQPTNQFMVGLFYKNIKNPIEYALKESGVHHDLELQPGNYGTAHNWGVEVDFTKYFRWFGIKGNYTFTNSKITTDKIIHARQIPSDPHSQLIDKTVKETRPLQGQAEISPIFPFYIKMNTMVLKLKLQGFIPESAWFRFLLIWIMICGQGPLYSLMPPFRNDYPVTLKFL